MSARSQQLQHLAQLINYLIAGATHIGRQHSIIKKSWSATVMMQLKHAKS